MRMCAMDVACQGGVLSDLVVDNGFSVGVIGLGGGIGRASGVGYLDIGLVLRLLRGSLPFGAGLGRDAFRGVPWFWSGVFVVPGAHGSAGHCGGGAPYMAGGSFELPAICMPWERFCG